MEYRSFYANRTQPIFFAFVFKHGCCEGTRKEYTPLRFPGARCINQVRHLLLPRRGAWTGSSVLSRGFNFEVGTRRSALHAPLGSASHAVPRRTLSPRQAAPRHARTRLPCKGSSRRGRGDVSGQQKPIHTAMTIQIGLCCLVWTSRGVSIPESDARQQRRHTSESEILSWPAGSPKTLLCFFCTFLFMHARGHPLRI